MDMDGIIQYIAGIMGWKICLSLTVLPSRGFILGSNGFLHKDNLCVKSDL